MFENNVMFENDLNVGAHCYAPADDMPPGNEIAPPMNNIPSCRGMSWRRTWYLIRTDHYRYHGQWKPLHLIKDLFYNRGFQATTAYRVAHYLYQNHWKIPLMLFNLYYFHLQSSYCFELPYNTQIGPGLYFGHVFGTIVNARCVFGKNINLSHGVTFGMIPKGPYQGAPIVEDNVYIAPGAKIIGRIRIGEGAVIGPNAVVIRDIPSQGVAVGIPATVKSFKGSADYVIRTVENETA